MSHEKRRYKIKDSTYAERAKKLRAIGFNVNFKRTSKIKGRARGSQKAAVTRAWEKASQFAANPEKNRFEFKRYTKTTPRSTWEKAVSSKQLMPGGVWIQRPRGVEKGKYRYRVSKKGRITITTSDRRQIRDVILRINMSAVAEDSKAELQRVLEGEKRPGQILLTVNGCDSADFADLEAFNRYLEDDLLKQLDESEFDFDRWGEEVFGLKLVYTPKGTKKKKDEGKRFDFTKGSIFSANSKRIYGTKKYQNRKKLTKKQGKEKGT